MNPSDRNDVAPTEDRPARVAVAIPTTGTIHRDCIASVRAMIRATRNARVELWTENDQPHDRCRNRLLRRLHDSSAVSHLLFVDSDEVVAPDTIDRLLAHDHPLVCGPVPTLHARYGRPDELRGVTVGTNVMMFDDPSMRGSAVAPDAPDCGYRRLDPDHFPTEPFFCDATGLGLCLIHRSLLDRITPPYCRFAGYETEHLVGEDVYFFRKARLAGVRPLVDPSVTADHLKTMDLTHLDLLFSDRMPVSPWPRRQAPRLPEGVLVLTGSDAGGLVPARTATVLEQWEREGSGRVRVEIVAGTAERALRELAERLARYPSEFRRVLWIGPSIIPEPQLLGLLATVEGPMVCPLTRTLTGGRIHWACWHRDAAGQPAAPSNISLPRLTEPFEVDAIDPACVMLDRRTFRALPDHPSADSSAPGQPRTQADRDRAFMHDWSDGVREQFGKGPVVAPLTVERRVELGLARMLDMKMQLKRICRRHPAQPATQPT